MSKRRWSHWSPAYVTFLLLVSGAAAAQGHGDAAAPALVKIAMTRMLVTPAGMTLYQFAADKANQSACSGGCAKAWPPFLAHTGIPATLPHSAGTFSLAARAGGLKQLTFNGAPLYTFSGDTKPGDMNGQGIIHQWWVVPAPGMSHAAGASFVSTASLRTLVTARGLSIYILATDKPGHAGCIGACAKFWPPVLATASSRFFTALAGIAGTFGSTQGAGQLTFNGAPLYTSVKDKRPGDMNGEGAAGVWWVVVPAPAHASTNAPTASPTATPEATTQAATTSTATNTATALATATIYVYKHY